LRSSERRGRLAFRDTLGAVLAKIFQRLGEPADPRFKTVTIEQLLQHRGGLARDVPPSIVDPSETLEARFVRAYADYVVYLRGIIDGDGSEQSA
jgi:CubicO group peptidase (beta-lactamase class C family)